MKIKSIHFYKQKLPLKRPYVIARSTIAEVEIVFLEIELYNGIKGIGSSSTDEDVVGENASHTIANLESDLVQDLVGKDIRHFNFLIDFYRQSFSKFPGTQAAIDIALHDTFCKWLDISVLDFYGRYHQQLLTSITIGIKGVEETLEEAKEYYDRGFRALKIKTGLDPDLDAERIIKLREKFRDYFSIRVDANTGYGLYELKIFLKRAKVTGIELVEQPFIPGNEKELLKLPAETRMMLAADESLKNSLSALELTHQMPYGIYNIKLMKCGGIRGAFEIAGIARPAGISLFWGCNDESIISIAAALHTAYACPHTKYVDLDGSLDLAEDIVNGGFVIKDGYMIPLSSPGLGVTLL